jgi:hypothetical protein
MDKAHKNARKQARAERAAAKAEAKAAKQKQKHGEHAEAPASAKVSDSDRVENANAFQGYRRNIRLAHQRSPAPIDAPALVCHLAFQPEKSSDPVHAVEEKYDELYAKRIGAINRLLERLFESKQVNAENRRTFREPNQTGIIGELEIELTDTLSVVLCTVHCFDISLSVTIQTEYTTLTFFASPNTVPEPAQGQPGPQGDIPAAHGACANALMGLSHLLAHRAQSHQPDANDAIPFPSRDLFEAGSARPRRAGSATACTRRP